MFLYKQLDLPKIPRYLIEQYIHVTDYTDENVGSPMTFYYSNPFRWDKGVNISFRNYDVSLELKQWLQENITDSAKGYSVFYTYATDNTYPTDLIPHIDSFRQYPVIYNLDIGGDNPVTRFYQYKDYPLEHKNGLSLKSYDGLTEIDSFVGPTESWYLINAHVVHSVGPLASPRIGIHLSLPDNHKFIP